MTRAELIQRFEIAFDEGLLRKLAFHIHDAYVDALEQASGLGEVFKRHAIPQIRHYVIQTRILHAIKRSRNVKASVHFSPTGTEPYIVLHSDNFHLTISMVKWPGQLPRPSDFRKANSEHNLFSGIETHEDEEHYAIFTHVPSWDNKEPVHMSIIFPDANYLGVYESINLNALIDFGLESSKTPSENIAKPEPKLRKRTRKKNTKGA